MSSESGAESSKRSLKIVEYIESLGIFPFMTETVIRKAAHVTEYAILTILSFNSIKYTNLISLQTSYSQTPVKIVKSDNEMYIVISFWISAVYSSIDEYH
ncbi:MAG: VanZ family protein, partial [Saccharofermentans sp.]|nr:VanZ family protein [Saccharofermentans sp.]